MNIIESLHVSYVAGTRRVEVKYGKRRVSVPGTHETLDEARVAAERYARRYLGMKSSPGEAATTG